MWKKDTEKRVIITAIVYRKSNSRISLYVKKKGWLEMWNARKKEGRIRKDVKSFCVEFSFKNKMIKGIFAYTCVYARTKDNGKTRHYITVRFPSYAISNLMRLSCLTQWIFYFILKYTSFFCSLCNNSLWIASIINA